MTRAIVKEIKSKEYQRSLVQVLLTMTISWRHLSPQQLDQLTLPLRNMKHNFNSTNPKSEITLSVNSS